MRIIVAINSVHIRDVVVLLLEALGHDVVAPKETIRDGTVLPGLSGESMRGDLLIFGSDTPIDKMSFSLPKEGINNLKVNEFDSAWIALNEVMNKLGLVIEKRAPQVEVTRDDKGNVVVVTTRRIIIRT
jgi:hypothetical protein